MKGTDKKKRGDPATRETQGGKDAKEESSPVLKASETFNMMLVIIYYKYIKLFLAIKKLGPKENRRQQ